MKMEHFMMAMKIVGRGGHCTFRTSNDAGVYSDKDEGKWGLYIRDCSHNVIKSLMAGGFTIGMKEGELWVTYHK